MNRASSEKSNLGSTGGAASACHHAEQSECERQCDTRRGLGNVDLVLQLIGQKELPLERDVVQLRFRSVRQEVGPDEPEAGRRARSEVGLGPDRATETVRHVDRDGAGPEVRVVHVVQVDQLVAVVETDEGVVKERAVA